MKVASMLASSIVERAVYMVGQEPTHDMSGVNKLPVCKGRRSDRVATRRQESAWEVGKAVFCLMKYGRYSVMLVWELHHTCQISIDRSYWHPANTRLCQVLSILGQCPCLAASGRNEWRVTWYVLGCSSILNDSHCGGIVATTLYSVRWFIQRRNTTPVRHTHHRVFVQTATRWLDTVRHVAVTQGMQFVCGQISSRFIFRMCHR